MLSAGANCRAIGSCKGRTIIVPVRRSFISYVLRQAQSKKAAFKRPFDRLWAVFAQRRLFVFACSFRSLTASAHAFVAFGRPGSDLLSRVLRRSTMGAGAFHGRVRNGNGCSRPAITTRSAKRNKLRSCRHSPVCLFRTSIRYSPGEHVFELFAWHQQLGKAEPPDVRRRPQRHSA